MYRLARIRNGLQVGGLGMVLWEKSGQRISSELFISVWVLAAPDLWKVLNKFDMLVSSSESMIARSGYLNFIPLFIVSFFCKSFRTLHLWSCPMSYSDSFIRTLGKHLIFVKAPGKFCCERFGLNIIEEMNIVGFVVVAMYDTMFVTRAFYSSGPHSESSLTSSRNELFSNIPILSSLPHAAMLELKMTAMLRRPADM